MRSEQLIPAAFAFVLSAGFWAFLNFALVSVVSAVPFGFVPGMILSSLAIGGIFAREAYRLHSR